MANAENQFEQGYTKEEWLDIWSDWVQGKVDKRGGIVPGEGSNTRAGAQWFNLVDDMMLAYLDGGAASAFEYVDNTAAPAAIPVVNILEFEDIQVDVTTDRNMLELTWFSVTRQTTSAAFDDLEITIAQDAAFNEVIIKTALSQAPGNPAFQQEAGFKGNTLMIGPQAKAIESPSAGVLRFYVRLENTASVGTSPALQFAFVAKAFDLTLTAIPDPVS